MMFCFAAAVGCCEIDDYHSMAVVITKYEFLICAANLVQVH